MHGLVNRAIERFVEDTYGAPAWVAIADAAGVESRGFEAFLHYDDALTEAVLAQACVHLGKPREALLEDLGIYLARLEAVRRLMRFSGVDYAEFLLSLDELPDRVRLGVPDLDLPRLEGTALDEGRFELTCSGAHPGFGAVLAGVLRAMADDYGALVLIDAEEGAEGHAVMQIELLAARFASGRRFDLAGPAL